jgi:hypothetical protein
MKQWPQGLWVVMTDGKVHGFHYHKNAPGVSYKQNQQLWVDGTRKMLEDALKAVGPLPARPVRSFNPFPDRGIGPTKDGGARLAVSVIGLRNGKQDGPPAVDSILLSKDEWAAFAPPVGKAEWSLSEAVGKKFAPAFSPLTDSIFTPRPADVTTATVTGTVVREGVIRYAGRWESLHHRDGDPKFPIRSAMTGEGVGDCDPKTGQFRSLVWVLKGTYRNGSNAGPIAAVVEWEQGPK